MPKIIRNAEKGCIKDDGKVYKYAGKAIKDAGKAIKDAEKGYNGCQKGAVEDMPERGYLV